MKDFHHHDKYDMNGCLGEDDDVVLMETEDHCKNESVYSTPLCPNTV